MYYILNTTFWLGVLMKHLFQYVRENKERLFTKIVCLYIYALYSRILFLCSDNILGQIDKDYNHFIENKYQWLVGNTAVQIDIAILMFISIIILMSFYLLYKQSKYFHAVLLVPIFFILTLMIITPVYTVLSSY